MRTHIRLATHTRPTTPYSPRSHHSLQSQSLSRSYGSNLPTSLPTLFYRLETLNLGDLLRIRVQAIENLSCPFHRFSRSNESVPTQQFNVMLYQSVIPYLSMKDFHGTYDCKTEKKTLSIPPIDVSMRASRCRDVARGARPQATNVYSIGYGIGTVFPFALC